MEPTTDFEGLTIRGGLDIEGLARLRTFEMNIKQPPEDEI